MELIPLERLSARALKPLFEEEERYWREQLHWDYRSSLNLIRRFVDAHLLAGYAAWEHQQPAGYAFYVLEGHKAIIAGVFISPRHRESAVSERLLTETMHTLQALPRLQRVEAQLIACSMETEAVLHRHHFRLYPRQFRVLELAAELPNGSTAASLPLERWRESFLEPCAQLIHLAYQNHVDSELNDQYCSPAGALRFLHNLIRLNGCGQFLPEASFVITAGSHEPAIGMVLTSAIAPAVAHTTQLCILPGYRGQGLGRKLMGASIEALRRRGFRQLTLTVTAANHPATALYERLGFRVHRLFPAGVWVC